MPKKNKIIIIVTVILMAAGGLIFLTGCGKISQDNGGGNEVLTVRQIDPSDHVRTSLATPFAALVQMIVYSDFQCPFCAEFAATMKKVEENFKDKVAIAFRHYPLAGHPEAAKAAEASECAAEQGKFWEMHDKLFADNVAGRLSEEQYKIDASDLGLDTARFSQCLDSGKFSAKVAEEMAEGKKAGVSGTPTSFINGNIYPGAYPFEDFTGSGGRQEKGLKSIIGGQLANLSVLSKTALISQNNCDTKKIISSVTFENGHVLIKSKLPLANKLSKEGETIYERKDSDSEDHSLFLEESLVFYETAECTHNFKLTSLTEGKAVISYKASCTPPGSPDIKECSFEISNNK